MPPILLTPRLRLRPPHPGDLDNIYRLGQNPRVMQYITPGKTQNMEEARQDLEKRIATSGDQLGYWITEEKNSGDFIGWMALKELEKTGSIEIGYRFLEEYWGRGYATEGGAKILDYAFRTLDLERVVAVARKENKASTRVMEKLGMMFVREGRFYETQCVLYEVQKGQYLAGRENHC